MEQQHKAAHTHFRMFTIEACCNGKKRSHFGHDACCVRVPNYDKAVLQQLSSASPSLLHGRVDRVEVGQRPSRQRQPRVHEEQMVRGPPTPGEFVPCFDSFGQGHTTSLPYACRDLNAIRKGKEKNKVGDGRPKGSPNPLAARLSASRTVLYP